MPKPLLLEVREKPITSMVIIICSTMWMLITQRRWGYDTLGTSYQKVIIDSEYWRTIVSQFSHIDFMHLVMNMSSLWSLGFVETMPRLGKMYYIKVTLLLLVFSKVVTLGLYYCLIKVLRRGYYRRVVSVGYSSVVFGWMSNLAIVRPRNGRYSLMGLPSIPMSMAPFASLILTSMMIPKASFWGHLGGILVGYMIGFGWFDWLNLFWIASLGFWTGLGILVQLIRQGRLNLPFLKFEGSNAQNDDPIILVNGQIP